MYLIRNPVNGKRYVGQTTRSVEVRFREHATCKKTLIGKAIQKYGEDNFRYGVIKTCASREELNYWEMHFIVVLKSKVPYGYNQTDGGEGAAGCIVTQETRDKRSAKLRGRKKSPSHCAKLSVSKTGKFLPPETCIKMSEAQRGEKSHNYGRTPTPEVSSKIAKKNRGKTQFQNLLRELEAHNLSYYGLAKLMGIAYTTVSAKMLGRLNFTAKDAAKLESIFGKSAEYLLKRDENCAEPAKARREDSPYKNLLKELDARNLSYRRFAELLGLSQTSVARKIRGERNFTIENKIKFTEIFGKPIEYLLKCE